MKTTARLLDYIDLNLLQDLQGFLAEAMGTTVLIADSWGNCIAVPSKQGGFQEFEGAGNRAATDSFPRCPGVSPATVTIFVAGICIGQCILGDKHPTSAAPPDIQSLIFMPIETERERIGALGFNQRTIRDWPPEALAIFGMVAKKLAQTLAGNTTARKWDLPALFTSEYSRPELRTRITT